MVCTELVIGASQSEPLSRPRVPGGRGAGRTRPRAPRPPGSSAPPAQKGPPRGPDARQTRRPHHGGEAARAHKGGVVSGEQKAGPDLPRHGWRFPTLLVTLGAPLPSLSLSFPPEVAAAQALWPSPREQTQPLDGGLPTSDACAELVAPTRKAGLARGPVEARPGMRSQAA